MHSTCQYLLSVQDPAHQTHIASGSRPVANSMIRLTWWEEQYYSHPLTISHNILVLMWVLLSRVFYLSSHDMPDFHIASAISLAAAVAVKTMFKIFQNEWHAFQFACSGLTNVAILVTRRLSSLQQFNSHSYPNNKHCHFSILVSTARQSLWLKSLYEQNNTIKLTPMKIQLSVYACANIWGSNTVAQHSTAGSCIRSLRFVRAMLAAASIVLSTNMA